MININWESFFGLILFSSSSLLYAEFCPKPYDAAHIPPPESWSIFSGNPQQVDGINFKTVVIHNIGNLGGVIVCNYEMPGSSASTPKSPFSLYRQVLGVEAANTHWTPAPFGGKQCSGDVFQCPFIITSD